MHCKVKVVKKQGLEPSEKLVNPRFSQCQLEHYTLFLLSEPKQMGCSRLAEILDNVSHDSVNRFLLRERYDPKDLFDIAKSIINLQGGILSVDDTVIEKHYSNPKCAELIGYFWSGKYHKTIKGLNLIQYLRQKKTRERTPCQEAGLFHSNSHFGKNRGYQLKPKKDLGARD